MKVLFRWFKSYCTGCELKKKKTVLPSALMALLNDQLIAKMIRDGNRRHFDVQHIRMLILLLPCYICQEWLAKSNVIVTRTVFEFLLKSSPSWMHSHVDILYSHQIRWDTHKKQLWKLVYEFTARSFLWPKIQRETDARSQTHLLCWRFHKDKHKFQVQ